MRKFMALMSVTALVVAGLGATAWSAVAPWSCPKGSVCFYGSYNGVNPICQTAVTNQRFRCEGALSYFNNGNPQRGKDHVYTTVILHRNGNVATQCIHYGPSEGRGNYPGSVTLGGITWGPECRA